MYKNFDQEPELSQKIFFLSLITLHYLKPYQSDNMCFNASVQLNQGTRKSRPVGTTAGPGLFIISYAFLGGPNNISQPYENI